MSSSAPTAPLRPAHAHGRRSALISIIAPSMLFFSCSANDADPRSTEGDDSGGPDAHAMADASRDQRNDARADVASDRPYPNETSATGGGGGAAGGGSTAGA